MFHDPVSVSDLCSDHFDQLHCQCIWLDLHVRKKLCPVLFRRAQLFSPFSCASAWFLVICCPEGIDLFEYGRIVPLKQFLTDQLLQNGRRHLLDDLFPDKCFAALFIAPASVFAAEYAQAQDATKAPVFFPSPF